MSRNGKEGFEMKLIKIENYFINPNNVSYLTLGKKYTGYNKELGINEYKDCVDTI